MVAISKTHIGNMALSHVGTRHNIENVDTEQSTEAEAVRLWYDFSRQQALESHDWNFARKRVVATLHSSTIPTTAGQPMAGVWGFRYKYPNDAVVIRKIQHPNSPPDDAFPFDVEVSPVGTEKTVLCNIENAVIVYTFDQTALNLYLPSFVLAFSLALAVNISFSLTGKLSLEKALREKFFRAIGAAGSSSANESVEAPPRDADWIRARSGGSRGTTGSPWSAFPDGDN